ncbi:MAG: metal-sensitive transcriptional regulator [Eubacteriales bacterium]|nr:metal-sensitive transcriptional regulator [Eubacteriales bacterium]
MNSIDVETGQEPVDFNPALTQLADIPSIPDTTAQALGRKLRIVRGQMDGLIRMIEAGRDGSDILTQLAASLGLLKSVEVDLIEAQLRSFMAEALLHREVDEAELEAYLKKLKKLL